jgi:O-antigen/teichoic acid export membrane protein
VRREEAVTARPEELVPAAPEDDSAPFLAGLFGRGLLYVAVTALPLVTAVVISPVLAHLLGPEQFGLLASAIALHQVLMAVAVFGVDQALILVRAETGGDRAPRMLITAGTMLALALTAGVGSTIGLWSDLLGFGSAQSLAMATVWWTVPTTFLQLALALLLARDRLRGYAVVSVLLSVGSQVAGLAFLLLLGDRTGAVFSWGATAGRVLAMVACLFLVVPAWFARGDWATIRSSFALGLPIALGALSMFVMNSGDRLVIQSMLGPAETGRYQIAYTIGFEAITVFAYTAKAWAARFAEIRDDARRWRLLGQSRDHLYELLAPTLLAVNLGAPLALRILAPESFRPEGLLVVVLLVSLSGVPTIAGLSSTRALIIQRRTRPIAVAAGVGAGANLGLNLVLVPVMGLEGAAAATAVAFTIEAVILRAAFRPYRAWPRTSLRIVALLAGTTAVSTVFAFVDQSPAWIAIRTVLAALCGGWLVMTYLRGRRAHTAPSRDPEPPAPPAPGEAGEAPAPAIDDTPTREPSRPTS